MNAELFYTIQPAIGEGPTLFHLYRNGRLATKQLFDRAVDAKMAGFRLSGGTSMPVRIYDGTERPVSAVWSTPLHRAIARNESEYAPFNEVVAVGRHHYLVRRSQWAVEIKVNYMVKHVEGQHYLHTRGVVIPFQESAVVAV